MRTTHLFVLITMAFAAFTPVPSLGGPMTYFGNTASGFGGAIGQGSLNLSDNGTTLSGTINRGSGGDFNDALVLYIDSVPGGFSTTSGFTDIADGLRKAISGFNGGVSRSELTFAPGFTPDYAIALGPDNEGFGGLWQLVNGGSHTFIGTANLTPLNTNTAPLYTFSVPVSQFGLTPNSGQTFGLLGTYVSNTGFRSDEAIAAAAFGGLQGHNPFLHTGPVETYTIAPVPEPSTLALGLGGSIAVVAWSVRRRRTRRTAP